MGHTEGCLGTDKSARMLFLVRQRSLHTTLCSASNPRRQPIPSVAAILLGRHLLFRRNLGCRFICAALLLLSGSSNGLACLVRQLFKIVEALRPVARVETTVYFVITFLKPLSFCVSLKFAELLPLPSRCLEFSYGGQISSST
ncbi:hypothetical protein KC19_11G065000 [Ceratodon purpureus]|uniref:Uncharacterized protein n=1 Tax=Ceratodon purpureus TaxID=3225 RepID=A0A8T0GCY0_CERPU|nr:hypothetical protein KC19_11G065000 [Ceratodon purpureus]